MARTYPTLRLGLPPGPAPDEQVEVDELHLESYRQFARYLAIVEGLDGSTVSATRLGWLSLWRQGLDLIFACLDAKVGGAAIATAALERLSTELVLKARAIATLGGRAGRKDGFVALAAWQLWQDRRTQQMELRHLCEIFDSSSTRQVDSNPTMKSLYEALHGELPLENDHVLAKWQEDASQILEQQSKPVEWWLADGMVRRWVAVIERLQRDLERPPSFPEVCAGRGKSTTAAQLRDMKMSFVYAQYSSASQVLHGSSIVHLLSLGAEGIEIGGPTSAFLSQKIGFANATLRNSWLLLNWTRKDVWGEVGRHDR